MSKEERHCADHLTMTEILAMYSSCLINVVNIEHAESKRKKELLALNRGAWMREQDLPKSDIRRVAKTLKE